MSTSWGTRKALGRRYTQDPALIMELDRLEKQYGLAAGREARAIQQSQFNRSLAQQQSQYDQSRSDAKTAGITGTIANLGTTAGMMRAMTKGKDEPFLGQTVSNLWDKAWGNTPTEGVAGFTQMAPGVEGIKASGYTPYVLDPAYVDATSAGIGSGAEVAAGSTPAAGLSIPGGPVLPAIAAYAGSMEAGRQLDKLPAVPNELVGVLKHPVTGVTGEGMKLLGKGTRIKELGNIGTELERVEEQVVNFITNPIGAISNIFGGW